MRAIEPAPPTALHQALDRLYAACQLPPPVVLVAREVDNFTRLVRLAGRPPGFAFCIAVVAFVTAYAIFVSLMAPGYPPRKSLGAGIAFSGLAVMMTIFRPGLFAFPAYDPRPARLVSVAAGAATLTVAGVVALATGSGIWGGAAAMWTAALTYALLMFLDAIGSPSQWLRLRMTWGARLPLLGALPIRDQLRPRLASAIAAAIAQQGRAADSAPSAERVDRAITAAFDRVWSSHSPLDPMLGRGLRGWQRESVDEVVGLADPPLLVAAALAVDRNCLAVTFFDRVAVALVPPEPQHLALPPTRSEAAGRALDALLLPWPYPMLARRLPLRWGEKLAAWLIDRERDPILRFTAIERMTPQRLFDAFGRAPADRGPEGELYVAGTAGVPTMMLRVVDLVPNEDGSERVHWIPVPPHMVRASEAVAWTFGQSPGGYRPSMQS